MYRKEKGKKLFVVIDGESWLLGRLDSVVMKGETKKPMHAQVRGGKNVNGLVLEWMLSI